MKLFTVAVLAFASFSLASCEVTKEITLNPDGSGKLSNTFDLSSMIGMAKMAGQGKDMDKLEKAKLDTSISLASMADSIGNLSAEEKAIVKKGTLDFKMNLEEDKFILHTLFPFTEPSQVDKIAAAGAKAMQQVVKKQLAKGEGGDMPPGMGDGDMPQGSIDDYFNTTYTKTTIEKKLNATKYATIGDDKGMQSLKEIAGQGLPISSTIIINLPRPAKKTSGKNVKLSEDKKKVTITEPLDEFFEDGKNLEYSIEY